MFPPKSHYGRYEERAERKLPQMGDVSVRTALTVHRGTANRSDTIRPVLVLGAEASDATKAIAHDLQITRSKASRSSSCTRAQSWSRTCAGSG